MARKMIINAVDPEEVRIAILDGTGTLQNLDIETRGVNKNKGNIYKGIVRAVEPSLNAAFVNYGADKEGFLTAGEVDPKLARKKDADPYRIDSLLQKGQPVLVQVEKDEVGSKGAVLTTYLSLAGRYVVLMPGANRRGVSRQIEDEKARKDMREKVANLAIPDGMGVIIRTAGMDRTKTDLNRDLKLLTRMWDNILKEEAKAKGAALILKEQDVIIRTLRDYLSTEVDEIVLDSDEAFDRAAEYMHLVMPKQKDSLTRYVERRPIFHHYRIEEQIDQLYTPRVSLPSGGSLVIEPTEALVAIDVNSGKQKNGGHEETALRTNLEAAGEVARQLRLRDLGGIVIIDFIDMLSRRHNRDVERTMREALKNDKARIKIGHISPNGTLELTRQRLRSALGASVFCACPTCTGTGRVLTPDSHAVAILRRIADRAAHGDLKSARVRTEAEAANRLLGGKINDVAELERRFHVQLVIAADSTLAAGQDHIDFETDPNAEIVALPEPDFGPPDDGENQRSSDNTDSTHSRRRKKTSRADMNPEPELDETEDDDEDEDEDEEMSTYNNDNNDNDNKRRRGRGGRNRGSGANERDAGQDSPSALAMPTFELIDLDTFRASDSQAEKRTGGSRPPRKRRRRAPRQNRPTSVAEIANIASAAMSGTKAAPPPLPPPPPPVQKKGGLGGFIKRLFGG